LIEVPPQSASPAEETPVATNVARVSPTVLPKPSRADPVDEAHADGQLPPRANVILGHLPPTFGLRDRWPLDDEMLDELAETVRLRRQIRQAAMATRAAFWLLVIDLVVFGVFRVACWAAVGVTAGEHPTLVLLGMMFAGTCCVFFYAAQDATLRCELWAPMAVGCVLLALVCIAAVWAFGWVFLTDEFGGPRTRGTPGHDVSVSKIFAALVVLALVGMLPIVFAALNFVGWSAIPRFLARPAWTLEALIYSKL